MRLDQSSPDDDSLASVEHYIGLTDAVELTGYASHYLRRLIRSGDLSSRGTSKDPLIPWSEVQRLRATQRPFWQVGTDQANYTPDLALDRPPAICGEAKDPPETAEQLWVVNDVVAAHVIDWLKAIPRGTVQSVIASPPYWGQRRYADETPIGWSDGEHVAYGREATVEGYVRHTMEIFRHLKRALREDGTIWWVLGDTYQTRTIIRESTVERWENYQGKRTTTWAGNPNRRQSAGHPYLKDKDLTLAPFLVAHGAQHLGLYVRSVIIWSKQQTVSTSANREPSRTHMPEPVQDRPTTGHEYILLLAKSDRYYYSENEVGTNGATELESLKDLRTVWSFQVSSNHGGHTAAFPIELPTRCIRLSTRPGDLVVDPFAGSGNTLIAAKRLGRQYAGCDISPTYVAEAKERLAGKQRRRGGKQRGDPASNPERSLQLELAAKDHE